MKKYYFLIVGFLFFGVANAQIVNIPDANFKARLLEADVTNASAKDLSGNYFKIDQNNDGQIQQTEALMVSYLNAGYSNISSLSGIGWFTNMQILYCPGNQLTSLDVSSLINLHVLSCSSNQINELILNDLIYLEQLDCENNQLATLNVSGLSSIESLYVKSNQLTSMNLNGLSNLKDFYGENNQLVSINLDGLDNLESLKCEFNLLTELNLNNLSSLKILSCNTNQLSNLNVAGLINLEALICDGNQISSLDISGLINIHTLSCSTNNINAIIFDNHPNLLGVICMYNEIETLDVSGLSNLWNLDCRENQLTTLNIKNGANEAVVEFSGNPNLQSICADGNQLTFIQNMLDDYGYSNCSVTSNCNLLSESFNENEIFSINPNPAKETLTINKQNIEISSISIYNTLGQLVQVIPNAKETKTIDVSQLKSGNYFIKVVSDKGASSSKFIKE